jgi:hypothetical protein
MIAGEGAASGKKGEKRGRDMELFVKKEREGVCVCERETVRDKTKHEMKGNESE